MHRYGRPLAFASFALFASFAACGGNVIVDELTGGSASSFAGTGGGGGSEGFGGAIAFTATAGGGMATTGLTTGGSSSVSTATVGAGGAGGCGSLHLYADQGCEGCAEMSCCAELAACDVGTPCFQLLDCDLNCAPGDPNCLGSCADQDADGAMALQALGSCFNDACSGEMCGQPSDAVCDADLPPNPSTACTACLTAACCAEAEACGDDMACITCYGGVPAGCDATYAALNACENMYCAGACP